MNFDTTESCTSHHNQIEGTQVRFLPQSVPSKFLIAQINACLQKERKEGGGKENISIAPESSLMLFCNHCHQSPHLIPGPWQQVSFLSFQFYVFLECLINKMRFCSLLSLASLPQHKEIHPHVSISSLYLFISKQYSAM